jgi:hypothetical protein
MGPVRVCYRRGRGGPGRLKRRDYYEFAELDSSAFGHRSFSCFRLCNEEQR